MANFARLTEKQKEALRLVGQGYSAKEIAVRVQGDVTYHAIKARIKDALKTLDMSDSREAARLLAAYEATYPARVYPSGELPAADQIGVLDATSDPGGAQRTNGSGARELREERPAFEAAPLKRRRSWLSLRKEGTPSNELTSLELLLRLAFAAGLLLLGAALLAGAVISATQLLRAYYNHVRVIQLTH